MDVHRLDALLVAEFAIRVSGMSVTSQRSRRPSCRQSMIRPSGSCGSIDSPASVIEIIRDRCFRSSSRSTSSRSPRRINATYSATRSTSLIWWLDRNTVRPSAARCTMLSRNSRRTMASSPEVGSSRISRSGSCDSAKVSETLARIPFDRFLIFAFGASPNSRAMAEKRSQ